MSAGCTVSFGGQFEAQQSASRTIVWMGAGIVVVMLLLVQGALGSLRAAAPLSVVVLGGLLSSTFLNLIVVPAGYHLLFHRAAPGPAAAPVITPSP